MQVIHDEENNIIIINGHNKNSGTVRDTLLDIPILLMHQVDRVIQVYINQKESRYVFNNIKSRHSKLGEFTPTKEEFDYIFEQLIGS